MKILQVIPANVKKESIVYSPFIESEIRGLESIDINIQKFFFISRMSIKDFFLSKKNLEKLIAEHKPDLIHVHTGSTTAFLVAAAKKRNVPWIVTFGGSELLGNHQPGLKWWIRDSVSVFLSKISARMCNGIICVSKNLQDALPSGCKKKSIVIPRGVDTLLFKPVCKLEARKQMNLSVDSTIVLFSMNRADAVVKNKKFADEIVQYIQAKYDIKINLISLIDYTKKEIVLLLNGADALLLTSLHEGSPNIVKEAMACNLPVVSVNCGDVAERLKNVNNSYVQPFDKELLGNSLYSVIIKKQRSNGREQLINQRIDVRSICLGIESFYKKIRL